MMKAKWPVYSSQVLTGIAGIGAILIAGQVTQWHILVSVILGIAVATSLGVTARAEADAQRNRSNMDTLLRAMELPYFIIKAITTTIGEIAAARGWEVTRQENFAKETLYELEAGDGSSGRLLVSEQGFKDLWILEAGDRKDAIERRMFGSAGSTPADEAEEDAVAVVLQTIAQHVSGSHRIAQLTRPDGERTFEVRTAENGVPLTTVQISANRFQQLLNIVPPVRRYYEIAREVRDALQKVDS